MNLPLRNDTLIEELNQIHKLLTEIKDRTEETVDMPMNDVAQELFQVQLRGELLLTSQRLMAIAELLSMD